jgi:hypothetical protein
VLKFHTNKKHYVKIKRKINHYQRRKTNHSPTSKRSIPKYQVGKESGLDPSYQNQLKTYFKN